MNDRLQLKTVEPDDPMAITAAEIEAASAHLHREALALAKAIDVQVLCAEIIQRGNKLILRVLTDLGTGRAQGDVFELDAPLRRLH